MLWSPSLRTAGWSGCSPPAVLGWQVGPACPCPTGHRPGLPGWASAPQLLEREGLAGGSGQGGYHQGSVGAGSGKDSGRGWARTAGFGGWAGNAGPTPRPPGPRVRSEQDWSSYCRPGPVGAPSTSEGSPSVRSGSKAGITVRDSTGTSRGSPPSTNIVCLRAEPFRRIWWEIFWGQEHSRLGPRPANGAPGVGSAGVQTRGTRDSGLSTS